MDWDARAKRLRITPRPGENLDREAVRVPTADMLLKADGVDHLTIRNIDFEASRYDLPAAGRHFPQAEADLPGAVLLTGTTASVIEDCAVRHTGGYGIEIGAGCKDVRVATCTLTDLGAGGVKIGEQGRTEDPKRLTERIAVEKCLIKGLGRIHPAGVGVWIGQSPYNIIRQNNIEDLYYTGISVGWSWGYGPSGSHHNLIEGNRIDRVGQGVLSDMGGIYTLGLAPGTVLTGNWISNVKCDPAGYGGWGIYPDEGSSGLLIEKNVVDHTSTAGFHQHYGADNIVRDNIFAYGGQYQMMRTRAEEHRSFSFDHNIVIWSSGPVIGSNWTGPGFEMDYNLYYSTDGKPLDFQGRTFAQWQAAGHDVHSLFADPLFRNPARGDFTLSPHSPAYRLGFTGANPPGANPPGANQAGAWRVDRLPNFAPAWPLQ